MDQRLPEQPLLVPVETVGQYGGVWRRAFLGPADAFLDLMDDVQRLDGPSFETDGLAPGVVVPASP